MVIYVDMLLLVNFAADYFLLKATAAMLKQSVLLWRMLLSAALASLFSLYIFLPPSGVLLQLLVRIVFSVALTLCAFGFKGKNFFIKACLLFFLINCAFGGAMTAVYNLFRPSKMAVRNSVVYFDISPLALILSSAAFYAVISAVNLFFSRKEATEKCEVVFYINNKSKNFSALIDTGNTLRDPFLQSEVIIVNEKDIKPLIDSACVYDKSRFCLMPCKTVTGSGILYGFRLDSAVIKDKTKSITLKKPIAIFSATDLEKDTALVNPDTVGE